MVHRMKKTVNEVKKMALTYTNYIPKGDGTYADLNELSEKEQAEARRKITDHLMKAMGYTRATGGNNENPKEKNA